MPTRQLVASSAAAVPTDSLFQAVIDKTALFRDAELRAQLASAQAAKSCCGCFGAREARESEDRLEIARADAIDALHRYCERPASGSSAASDLRMALHVPAALLAEVSHQGLQRQFQDLGV